MLIYILCSHQIVILLNVCLLLRTVLSMSRREWKLSIIIFRIHHLLFPLGTFMFLFPLLDYLSLQWLLPFAKVKGNIKKADHKLETATPGEGTDQCTQEDEHPLSLLLLVLIPMLSQVVQMLASDNNSRPFFEKSYQYHETGIPKNSSHYFLVLRA